MPPTNASLSDIYPCPTWLTAHHFQRPTSGGKTGPTHTSSIEGKCHGPLTTRLRLRHWHKVHLTCHAHSFDPRLYQRSQSSSWVPDPFYRFGIVLHPVCDWSAYRRPLHILANSPCWSFRETESRLDPLIQGSTALKYFYISFLCLHLLEANTSSKFAF